MSDSNVLSDALWKVSEIWILFLKFKWLQRCGRTQWPYFLEQLEYEWNWYLFKIRFRRTTCLLVLLQLNYQHTSWLWRPSIYNGGTQGTSASWRTMRCSPLPLQFWPSKQGINSSPGKALILQGSFVIVTIFFFNKFILSSPRQIHSVPPKWLSHYCLDTSQLVATHPLYLSTSITLF